MFQRFGNRARKVMVSAHQEARRLNHEYLGTEHILLGIVKEDSCTGACVLKGFGFDLMDIQLAVHKLIKPGPELDKLRTLRETPRAKKVIEFANSEARQLNFDYVSSGLLLLGLLLEQDGVAAQVLMNLGMTIEHTRAEVVRILSEGEWEYVPSEEWTLDDRRIVSLRILRKAREMYTQNNVKVVPIGYMLDAVDRALTILTQDATYLNEYKDKWVD